MSRQYKRVVGIDCGEKGGLGLIDGTGELSLLYDMPLFKDGKIKLIDGMALRSMLLSMEPDVIVVEQLNTMPRDGRVGAFTLGGYYQAVTAVSMTVECPLHLVRPAVWKRKLGLIGWSEAAIVKYFKKLFPEQAAKLYGPRGGLKDGRLDAGLIAHYGKHFVKL